MITKVLTLCFVIVVLAKIVISESIVKCILDIDCNEGSFCEQGVCQRILSRRPIMIRCGNATCMFEEECIYPSEFCPTCNPHPFCWSVHIPIYPCGETLCKVGYKCKILDCPVAPCPQSTCVPINPCENAECLEGYDCVPNVLNPSWADCVPSDPCSTVRCQVGYECVVVTTDCIDLSCPPPYGECLPSDVDVPQVLPGTIL